MLLVLGLAAMASAAPPDTIVDDKMLGKCLLRISFKDLDFLYNIVNTFGRISPEGAIFVLIFFY